MEGPKEDVLTAALMSKEHDGRVRAVGSHVTPKLYFNIPRQKSVQMDLFLSQQEELKEAKARIQKLEAAVFKTEASAVYTDENGSCSGKSEHPLKPSNAEPATNLPIVKKPDDANEVVEISELDALKVYLETLLMLGTHNCNMHIVGLNRLMHLVG